MMHTLLKLFIGSSLVTLAHAAPMALPQPNSTPAPQAASNQSFTIPQNAQNTTVPSKAQAAKPAADKVSLLVAARVVWVQGTVQASYPDQSTRILTRGASLYEQDTLVTTAEATGEIAFTDNSILTLRPNTTMKITKYRYDDSHPEAGNHYVLELIKGGFRTITGFVAKAQPDSYEVRTPVATIGVRGTDYDMVCPMHPEPVQCFFGLLGGKGVTLTNETGTVLLTASTPYAFVESYTTKPVLSGLAPSVLAKTPPITPATIPRAGEREGNGANSGNCGILIN